MCSCGAPSALQMARGHPARTRALVLLVSMAYKKQVLADSAPSLPPWVESWLTRLTRSEFLFWPTLHIARDQVIKVVLAPTPACLPKPEERSAKRRAEKKCVSQERGWRGSNPRPWPSTSQVKNATM